MELNMFKHWTVICSLVLINEVLRVAAGYCRYTTHSGLEKVRYCDGTCCADTDNGKICCGHGYQYGPFVLAGVGAMLVLAVVALCTIYICCKRKITDNYRRTHATPNPGTQPHQSLRERIPSVSVSVEPTPPPPYEYLPPPYYTNEIEIGENSEEKKDNIKRYPDYPPPEYTPFSEAGT